MNSFQKITDLLLAIIVLFLLPMFYSGWMLENVREVISREYVKEFIAIVQEQGMLSYDVYQEFQNKFMEYGKEGKIELLIERTIYVPVAGEDGEPTGETLQLRDEVRTEAILTMLKKTGRFRMQKGDCFTCSIKLPENNMAAALGAWLPGNIFQDDKKVLAAGYIRNENWRTVN